MLLYIVANEAGGGIGKDVLSGGDRIVIEFVRRWLKSNVKVKMLVSMSGFLLYGKYLPSIQNFTVILRSLRDSRFSELVPYIAFFELRLLLHALISILKLKEKDRVQVVYSASEYLVDLIPAIILKRRLKAKLIATFYLFAPRPSNTVYTGRRRVRGLLYFLMQSISYRLVKRFADMIWVNNEYDRQMFIDRKKFTSENIIAVGPGVDMKLSSQVSGVANKKYDAIFIGRLHPQKGVLELMDIWRLVCNKKPDTRLAIIGVGYLESELRRKIEKYALSNNVELLGFKNGIEKVVIFKASKIVLHPAIYESGGMATLEAMACGLPGICFDLLVYRVYYPKGMLKTPCYDLRAFAENILRLLSDDELYKRTAKDALDWARKWDWDNRAYELLRTIGKLF